MMLRIFSVGMKSRELYQEWCFLHYMSYSSLYSSCEQELANLSEHFV